MCLLFLWIFTTVFFFSNSWFFIFTERVHDPSSNLEAQRGILTKTPEKLSEYLSI